MIKELWTLIKMLFASKPSEKEKVSLLGMKHFPFRGYSYMMWCGWMIYRNETYERRQKEWSTDKFKQQENHEMIHLMQAKAAGSWVKYYWQYFLEWLKGNPIIAPASSAYYTNPFECEAYANENNVNYVKGYDEAKLQKYIFKNRKSLYKQTGGTSAAWKLYLGKI